jgi:hypothetical protein
MAVQALAGADCVKNALDVCAAGRNGALIGAVGEDGKEFSIQRDGLLAVNRLYGALFGDNIQLGAIRSLDGLAFLNNITLMQLANFALGVSGGCLALQTGCFELCHDHLPRKFDIRASYG